MGMGDYLHRMFLYLGVVVLVAAFAVLMGWFISQKLQRIITEPVQELVVAAGPKAEAGEGPAAGAEDAGPQRVLIARVGPAAKAEFAKQYPFVKVPAKGKSR